MTDKSFGDHVNRNIVKNPLLSTAVTGLSLDDLTQNAILLPVPLNQESTTPQAAHGTQTRPLAHADNPKPNQPHGDVNANATQNTQHSTTSLHQIYPNPTLNLEDSTSATHSKASQKSTDDFDVNEYFARLHGTRYVSAPLNSGNTDLNTTEDSLEEINLNEPDRAVPQHSLTADIAQNFSQLPTVLPQVASAVFSSFSNMLNMKSKEQTPDEGRQYDVGYQEVDFAAPAPDVKPKEIGLPPKDMASVGTSNYRLPTKKKYAQIPGLSAGDTVQFPMYNPAAQTNPTTYFVPDAPTDKPGSLDNTQNISQNAPQNADVTEKQMPNTYVQKTDSQNIQMPTQPVNFDPKALVKRIELAAQQANQCIPPPPMFSNVEKKEGQTVGRTVLPPSVARRIGANHPVIKAQSATTVMPDNIFVPAPVEAQAEVQNQFANTAMNFRESASSAVEFASPLNPVSSDKTSQCIDSTSQVTIPPPTVFSTPAQIAIESGSLCINAPPMFAAEIAKSKELPPPPTFYNPGISMQQMPPTVFNPQLPGKQSLIETSQLPMVPSETGLPPPSTFFNPSTLPASQNDIPQNIPRNEQPQTLVEPPKSLGAVNYRMSKKRPQYYAGPIVGVGSMSNNVKPLVDAIENPSFQGDLFTPQTQNTSEIGQDTPYDISRPVLASQTYGMSQQDYTPAEYNTAFDLSCPISEATNYDQPKPESKGFGIIGSLKSKLSSIDINKIQSSVTTFFDPTYNAIKKEEEAAGYSSFSLSQDNPPNYFSIYNTSNMPLVEDNYSVPQAHTFNIQDPRQDLSTGFVTDQRSVIGPPPSYAASENALKVDPSLDFPQNPTASSNTMSNTMFNPGLSVADSMPNPFLDPDIFAIRRPLELISATERTFPSSFEPNAIKKMIEKSHKQKKPSLAMQEAMKQAAVKKSLPCPKSFFDEARKISESESTDKTSEFPTPVNLFAPSNSDDVIETKMADLKVATDELPTPANFYASGNLQSQQMTVTGFAFDSDANLQKALKQADNGTPQKGPYELSNKAIDNNDAFDMTKISEAQNKTIGDADFRNNMANSDNKDTISILSNDDGEDQILEICTTCREVDNADEEIENSLEDVTSQLIENITSPIQLSNPVEAPLTEGNTTDPDANFEPNQCAEISHMTESTMETIQVQSANDIIHEDANNVTGYGWKFDTSQFKDHDFTVNSNTIGFFDTPLETIPTNASDEIKAELKCHDEPSIVLPKPSAPPEKEIVEEIGLDVNSIEQDANQDFPVYEEFVVEPSETDDDKIEFKERKSSESDTFTSRVERFKKLGENETVPIPLIISDPTAPIPIPSYFDTGNFAADTHYKNSMTSPSNIVFASGGNLQIMFDDNNQPNVKGDKDIFVPYIPDCTTQTKPVYSPTFSTARTPDVTSTVFSGVREFSHFQPNYSENRAEFDVAVGEKSFNSEPKTLAEISEYAPFTPFIPSVEPSFPNPIDIKSVLKAPLMLLHDNITVTGSVGRYSLQNPSFQRRESQIEDIEEEIELNTPIINLLGHDIAKEIIEPENPILKPKAERRENTIPNIFNLESDTEKLKSIDTKLPENDDEMKPDPSKSNLLSIFGANEPYKQMASLENLNQPDSVNFFATNSGEDSGNRLASYFGAPSKADNTKSFFELSLGQDHFKHKPNLAAGDINNAASIQNLTQEKYLANLKLMKELTAPDNMQVGVDQTVRHVNYFTVEYDNEKLTLPNQPADLNKGEPFKTDEQKTELNDRQYQIKCVIQNCKHCCNLKTGLIKYFTNLDHESLVTKEFKVKKCMDSNTQGKQDANTNMAKSEGADKASITISMENKAFAEETGETSGTMVENRTNSEYVPVKHHWFYRIDADGKSTWRGFSLADNQALETAFNSPELSDDTVVATDGGRFDVHVTGRIRTAVYWTDQPTQVRRCSWFYKGTTDARYVPYTEAVAEKLEEEYRHGMTTGEWHRRLVLPDQELVVMHGPAVMVHFLQSTATDAFSAPTLFSFGKYVYRNPPKINVCKDQTGKIDHLLLMVHGAGEYKCWKERTQSTIRPRVVRRGHDDTEIEDVEPSSIDHLLLLCHGVGSACDMRFRSVEEVVDDFRSTSLQLLQSHYKNSCENGVVGRVEVLPISWHTALHAGEAGVDARLARVTLQSIPRLRAFTNDTVLDVLLYTSPIYCQTIIDTVCNELNRIYELFKKRNPDFKGDVSLGGHSLGSVILYDLLCHQPTKEQMQCFPNKRYVDGTAGTGQPTVLYPSINFEPVALYALGSPIAIFECIRGVDSLDPGFCLPTCRHFFNIFHPYDPIAYRIEPLINPQLGAVKPFLIPHHKGRKRMHLELKDTMARVGADLKQKLMESIKSTWSTMWRQTSSPHDSSLEKVVEEEIEKEPLAEDKEEPAAANLQPTAEMLGKLNAGRRVDYVLQEAPLEMINEYLFAMSSHVGYWESEDTMLLVLHEIYSALGVRPDCTVPQGNLTVNRTKVGEDDADVLVATPDRPSTSRASSAKFQ